MCACLQWYVPTCMNPLAPWRAGRGSWRHWRPGSGKTGSYPSRRFTGFFWQLNNSTDLCAFGEIHSCDDWRPRPHSFKPKATCLFLLLTQNRKIEKFGKRPYSQGFPTSQIKKSRLAKKEKPGARNIQKKDLLEVLRDLAGTTFTFLRE